MIRVRRLTLLLAIASLPLVSRLQQQRDVRTAAGTLTDPAVRL